MQKKSVAEHLTLNTLAPLAQIVFQSWYVSYFKLEFEYAYVWQKLLRSTRDFDNYSALY